MAGSKRWFVYTLDDGTTCGIQADESNVEAVNGGAASEPTPISRPTRQAPKGTRIRSAVFKSANGLRTLVIPVLNQTIYNGVPANFPTLTDPIGGNGAAALNFDRLIPEKSRRPKWGVDTGLTDGDTPG
jgi:hypothetical protein